MEKIIERLASLAEELDSKELSIHADTVDGVTKTILGVKTAQYVGIQGYWVRNSRCWENCYRQKRSSNPEMPSQEVWAECHKEYTKSIDNDGARKEWDKYAGSEEVTIKTAARQEADARLNAVIQELMSSGSSLGRAVLSAISSQKDAESNYSKIIAASQSLVKVAEIVEKSDFELSTRIGKAAQELSKEAQWWNPANLVGRTWMAGQDKLRNIGQGFHDKEVARQRAKHDNSKNRLQELGTRGNQFGYSPQKPQVPATGGSPAASPNINGPGIAPNGNTGGTYTPSAGPNNQTAPAANAAPIVSNLSSLLKQLHDASRGDEGAFRSYFGMALKMSGIPIGSNGSKPNAAPTPAATSNTAGPGLNQANPQVSWAGVKPRFSGGKYTGNLGTAYPSVPTPSIV